ncbi:MAG: CYTH domain-containing protein [Bacilli bacterium]|nr:CYTH domain-containing protein [Bacilli bacterium]
MKKQPEIEFKSLLTKEEYLRLMDKFKGNRTNIQTNHYFDTPRFTLKAYEASLRVREREDFEMTLKKKKGYALIEATIPITKEEFEEIKATGVIKNSEIMSELAPLIGNQKVENFLSLQTLRMYLPYGNGVLFIDKSKYLGFVDYELEYEAKSYHQGKQEFIDLINDLQIQYKKSDKKIARAFNAYKRVHSEG